MRTASWHLKARFIPQASVIGNAAGSTGTATIDGIGSTWTSSGTLYIGSSGTGTLTVSNGGSVNSGPGRIGQNAGSAGTVTVDGGGSSWTSSGTLYIGSSGTGTLTVSNGGSVSSNGSSIGSMAGSMGTVAVRGADSAWMNIAGLYVGQSGNAQLIVSDQGTIENTSFITVGRNTGSIGSMLIESGAVVHSSDGEIAFAGGQGSVTITGAGSRWIVDSYLDLAATNPTIPQSGTGTLTLANGGVLSMPGAIYIANTSQANGTLNIGAPAGSAPVAPGTLIANSVQFGAGTGTINFNHTSNAYVFTPAITGSGTINALAGNTLLAGDVSGFAGAVNVSPGANISTGAAQVSSMHDLAARQQTMMIESRAVTNQLLGFTRPIDSSNYAYAGAQFGSAEGLAGGQYSNKGLTLIGGLAYGQQEFLGITQSDAATIAAAARYMIDDPFGDEGSRLHPFAEIGGWVTPDEGLTFNRSYNVNSIKGGPNVTGSGNTNATAWAAYGRLGLAWNADDENQLAGFGEVGRQALSFGGYNESTGPFPATVGGGEASFFVSRLGGSWTRDLYHLIYAPWSLTLAGAIARSFDAHSGLNADIGGYGIGVQSTDQTWGEFGARINAAITSRISLSFGLDGTAGGGAVGTSVHGDVELGYRF